MDSCCSLDRRFLDSYRGFRVGDPIKALIGGQLVDATIERLDIAYFDVRIYSCVVLSANWRVDSASGQVFAKLYS